jgi:hypothetical protein
MGSIARIALLAVGLLVVAACASGPRSWTGIYRQGFEQSHFYPDTGGGPWWVTWDGDVLGDRLEPFRTGEGRGRVALVRLTVTGELSRDDLPNFLGPFGAGVKVTEATGFSQATEADFTAAVTAGRD